MDMAESVKAATMEEFRQTPYYQGLGIEALEKELAGYNQTDEALKAQAEAQYRPAYESEREAAQQALEKEVAGYRAQLSGTGAAYDRQRRNANQAYEESAAELNNQLTKRGLGRSSLVSAQGAYLQNQRNQALAEIDRAEGDAINTINERIALLTEQAARSERTMAGSYAQKLQSRVDELKEKNRSASISLQLQIAALQQQGYEAYQDWLLANRKQEVEEKEFEAEYGDILNEDTASGSSDGSFSGGGSVGKQQAASAVKKETEKSKGVMTKTAGAAVNSLTEGVKKLISSIASGVKAASAVQKKASAKGTSGSTATAAAKAGARSIRQNAKL